MRRLLAVLLLASGVCVAQDPALRMDQAAVRIDGKAGGTTPHTSYLSADVTNNTLALASSGLSMTVEAGRKYGFGCTLFVAQATAASGLAFDFAGGSATASIFRASSVYFDNSALKGATQSTALATVSAVTATGNNPGHLLVSGAIEPATAGTLVPRFANYGGTAVGNGTNLWRQSFAAAADGTLYQFTTASVINKYSAGAWAALGTAWRSYETIAPHPTNPSILYISTNNGKSGNDGYIHKSTDAGATWARSDSGLVAAPMHYLYIDPADPNRMYASNQVSLYVYRSTDAGATWASATTGITGGETPRNFAVDPFNSANVYLGAFNSGSVYKSTDYGASWALSNTGLGTTGNQTVFTHPTIADMVFVASGDTNAGVWRSTDAGATWAASNTGLPAATTSKAFWMAFDTSTSPPLVYVATQGSPYFYKSTDSGATWSAAGTNLAAAYTQIVYVTGTPKVVYISQNVSGAVYKSMDAAMTWLKVVNESALVVKRGSNCTLTSMP